MVLFVNEYTMQQQKNSAARFQQGQKESKMDDATEEEKRLAKEFGMSVAVYRLRQRDYVDATKQGKDDRKAREADDPKIGEEGNEEQKSAGGGMIGGRGRGVGNNELTDTIEVMNYAGPGGVDKERLEKEERALQEMKSQHQQRQQQENHEHQHGQHENYQVIEVGIEESVVEDYVQISPYVSSYEQDINERGRGGNNQQQQPNLPVMAEGMRFQPPQQSPRAQHLNEGETASLPSLLNDGTPNHNSPHYDHNRHHQSRDDQDHRYYHHNNQHYNQDPNRDHQGYYHDSQDHGYYNRDNQDWRPHDPHDHRDPSHHHPPDPPYPRDPYQGPPPDPHHQFTIGSMVCVDVQRGDPLYGVVKWIGTVPDYPGTIAGVELVNVYAI